MSKIQHPTGLAGPWPGRRRARRGTWTAFGALVLALGLTACDAPGSGGSAAPGGQNVASLPQPSSTGPGGGSPSADPDPGRPQLRLDTSPEEKQQFLQAFYQCLAQHGFPMSPHHPPGYTGVPLTNNDSYAENPAAYNACRSKQPLEPVETDPDKNPHFQDDLRAEINCDNAHGLKTEVSPDGRFPSFNEPMPSNWGDISQQCLMETFGAHK
ncbi:hypothetical protein ACWCXH_23995 [Kitasatospora sp. NPDC001660]